MNFCIYNYAEYYPAVTKTADNDGKASLTAGLGDLIVWATGGESFGYAKGSPRDYAAGNTPALKVVLDKKQSDSVTEEFNITPHPPARSYRP